MNLSSTIVLNKIPEQFYRPRTAVDRSEITRCEKITTEIFPKVEEGAKLIANTIEAEIKAAQTAGRECVLGLGTGQSLTPVFEELIRRHEEGLSFANVVVFNAYEYFPLKVGSKNSSLLNKLTFGANNSKIKNPKTDSDWISSDPVSVDIYKMDRMCGFVCSSGFMLNLYRLLGNIHKKRNMKKIPKELPVKIMAGTDDPVGLYGKSVSKLASIYCRNGIRDLSLKLYSGARHELLNDKCRYDVINEIIAYCKK